MRIQASQLNGDVIGKRITYWKPNKPDYPYRTQKVTVLVHKKGNNVIVHHGIGLAQAELRGDYEVEIDE